MGDSEERVLDMILGELKKQDRHNEKLHEKFDAVDTRVQSIEKDMAVIKSVRRDSLLLGSGGAVGTGGVFLLVKMLIEKLG